MTNITGDVLMIVLAVIAIVVMITLIPIMTAVVSEAVSGRLNGPDEHDIYLHYRDVNDCTKANDSYCVSRGGCVHMYMACQHERCGVEI